MKGYRRWILMGGLLAAVTACQSAEVPDREGKVAQTLQQMELRLGEQQSSLSNFTVNGFRPIDDSNLIVTSGTQDHYLLTLVNPCLELPFALSVGFERRSTNISNFDSIVVNPPNRRAETCRIDRIFRLESTGSAAGD